MATVKAAIAITLATIGAGAAGFAGDRYIFSKQPVKPQNSLVLTSEKEQGSGTEGVKAQPASNPAPKPDKAKSRKGQRGGNKCVKNPSSERCKAKQAKTQGGSR